MGSSILQAILGGVAGGASGITAVRDQRRMEEEQRQKAEEAKRQAERQAMLDRIGLSERGWVTPEQQASTMRQAAPGLQSLAGAAGAMMRGGAPSPVDMDSLQRGAGQFGAPAGRATMGGQEYMLPETPAARALREAEAASGRERRKTQEAAQTRLVEKQREIAAAEAERVASVEALVGAGIPRAQAEAASRTGARYGDVLETPSIAATKRGQDISAATARRGQDLSAEGAAARLAGGGAGAKGPSALQQMMLSRVQVAKRQSRSAHDEMVAFEERLISGEQKPISATDATLATRAFGSGIDAKYAEGMLNKNNPELARYIRNAKAIGASERLVMPRGGSNLLMNLETALAGVGPGASPDLIRTTQQFRAGLVEGLEQETGASLLEAENERMESALGSPEDRMVQPAAASPSPEAEARAWRNANPPQPGETPEAYARRFQQRQRP
jgi:hypothetical protein